MWWVVKVTPRPLYPLGIRWYPFYRMRVYVYLMYVFIHVRMYVHMYKVVQILPGRFVCKQVTVCPGHI
jgi:hypothetical protein